MFPGEKLITDESPNMEENEIESMDELMMIDDVDENFSRGSSINKYEIS